MSFINPVENDSSDDNSDDNYLGVRKSRAVNLENRNYNIERKAMMGINRDKKIYIAERSDSLSNLASSLSDDKSNG